MGRKGVQSNVQSSFSFFIRSWQFCTKLTKYSRKYFYCLQWVSDLGPLVFYPHIFLTVLTDLQANAKLAQSGRCDGRTQEGPGSMPTGGKFIFCLNILVSNAVQNCQLCIITENLECKTLNYLAKFANEFNISIRISGMNLTNSFDVCHMSVSGQSFSSDDIFSMWNKMQRSYTSFYHQEITISFKYTVHCSWLLIFYIYFRHFMTNK